MPLEATLHEEHERRQFDIPADNTELAKKVAFMNATSIVVGLLLALLTILLLHRMRHLKPRTAGYGTQRMCPSCGLITSRLRACCMVCGKPLKGVVYSTVEK